MSGRWIDGGRLALGTFTIVPVIPPRRVDPPRAAIAMVLAPLIGAALGTVAVAVGWAVLRGTSLPFLAGVAAVAVSTVLTRGLHLDGLADTADGLGSGKRGSDALAVMRRGDIGPFGVTTLTLFVLANSTLLGALLDSGHFTWAVVGMVSGRLAVPLCTARGMPSARETGLGATVVGTVPRLAVVAVVALVTVLASAVAGPLAAVAAVTAALAATAWVLWRCIKRLGGISGDVIGAAIESASLAALVALVVVAT